jgi:LysR family glycine cleavage system transcriptional activator
MRRRLVHLNALRAFEASARLGGFTAAAAELGVSPAAVGQQVRMLESYYGIALFERQGKRLSPSEAAHAVLSDVRDAFDRLAQASGKLRDARGGQLVTLTLPPSFVAKWLMPRLEAFRLAFPDIDLRLDTTDRIIDLAREGVELGVRYGQGHYPGLAAEKLIDEHVFPVCSPALLSSKGAVDSPEALGRFKLVHDTTLQRMAGFPGWSAWFNAAGARGVDARRGLRVNSSIMALQAAIDGQGLALGRSVVVADDCRSGRLVCAYPFWLATGASYFLVSVPGRRLSRAAQAFVDWFRSEVSRFGRERQD